MLDKSRKTMTFKPLSVAENDYKSDCLAAESVTHYYGPGGCGCVTTRVEVSDKGKINITNADGGRFTKIEIKNADIKSLIEFLQDAELFISEAKLFNTIRASQSTLRV
jgi:hypothetical protein